MIVVVVGGSVLMFLVKSGSVAVLVDAERQAPLVEQPPLRSGVVRQGGRFSLEAFSDGCTTFGRRFVRLGLILTAAYAVSVALYLALIVVFVPLDERHRCRVAWHGVRGRLDR